MARIDCESSHYPLFEYTKFVRRQRWMRGKVFAADGKWITVKHGRDYPGMGAVGDAHGYKRGNSSAA